MSYIKVLFNVAHFFMKTYSPSFRTVLLLFLVFFIGKNIQAQVDQAPDGMNNKKMAAIFKAEAENLDGELGSWKMMYGGSLLFVLTDESNNRMRIFTPIIEETELKEGQMKKMLEANFHSALDSKYSLYEGYVISVFTHPLKELQKDQLIDAMRQVVVLSRTFGDSYSSTGLVFGGGQSDEETEEKKEEKKKKSKKM